MPAATRTRAVARAPCRVLAHRRRDGRELAYDAVHLASLLFVALAALSAAPSLAAATVEAENAQRSSEQHADADHGGAAPSFAVGDVAERVSWLASHGGGMSVGEYAHVAGVVLRASITRRAAAGGAAGGANVLVFGCGRDSSLWSSLNPGGVTVFVEDQPKWAEETAAACPDCRVLLVEYSTLLACDARTELADDACLVHPDVVEASRQLGIEQWDVILVDAPTGYSSFSPGRMQSLATAKLLSSEGTDILVHDCERVAEWTFSKLLFRDSDDFAEIAGTGPCINRICHFVRVSDDNGIALAKYEMEYVEGDAGQRCRLGNTRPGGCQPHQVSLDASGTLSVHAFDLSRALACRGCCAHLGIHEDKRDCLGVTTVAALRRLAALREEVVDDARLEECVESFASTIMSMRANSTGLEEPACQMN